MPSNLAIDDRLLKQALKVGGHKTKRETVNEALQEYILRRRQKEVTRLFNTIDYDPSYNYKAAREKS